ncbi:response regulator transcription factor [Streptomyces sp. A7024]|uniref:Response regulator transcription factor n=1 Tax=Streptomyces coryli TaxID=1128680 RepID=A0A6G4TRY8_9ACTN|nr:response regulator transcription factor [Streptomyces coryli]NGN62552.1 response regulator transcription factor [Streptomyces coryli]
MIVLTGTDDLELGQQALMAGAHGFLTKSSDPAVLVAPLLTIASGLCVLERDMVDALLATARKSPGRAPGQALRPGAAALGPPCAGRGYSDFAQRMLASDRTAKRMISALLRKIHATNRTEAAGLTGRYGILDATVAD